MVLLSAVSWACFRVTGAEGNSPQVGWDGGSDSDRLVSLNPVGADAKGHVKKTVL